MAAFITVAIISGEFPIETHGYLYLNGGLCIIVLLVSRKSQFLGEVILYALILTCLSFIFFGFFDKIEAGRVNRLNPFYYGYELACGAVLV